MVDVDIYVINDEEYYLLGEENINDTSYLYFSNVANEDEVMFRKRDKDDPEILLALDSDDEVKMAALVFANKILG